MKIDFANLKHQYQLYKKDIDDGITRVLENSNYIMGNEIIEFEEDLKNFTNSKYAYSCSSGTDALILALMAIGVKAGDEVITTSFSFISTAETIAILGAKPVFVDVEEDTYNIDVSQIEKKINKKTKAIISVSLYGQTSDIDAIDNLANKYKITHIIDGAQSFGAKYKDKYDSNLGHISTTSFFPSKPLGCYGDGGAIFTNDDHLAEDCKAIRIHGTKKDKYNSEMVGLNGRLDSIQAAVLLEKLSLFDEELQMRNKVNFYYRKYLNNAQYHPNEYKSAHALFSIVLSSNEKRENLIERLSANGIPSVVYYKFPIHLMKAFRGPNFQKKSLPVSEKLSDSILSLPMHPYLSKDDIDEIVQVIKNK